MPLFSLVAPLSVKITGFKTKTMATGFETKTKITRFKIKTKTAKFNNEIKINPVSLPLMGLHWHLRHNLRAPVKSR